MSRLLSIAAAVALLAAFPARARGQTSDPPPTTTTATLALPDGPFTGLGLSNAQAAALSALTARTRAATVAITSHLTSGAPMPPDARAALHQIAVDHNTEARALLTAAQREKLEANLAVLRAHLAQARQQRSGTRRLP